jgi:hypothetical protein
MFPASPPEKVGDDHRFNTSSVAGLTDASGEASVIREKATTNVAMQNLLPAR